ncbi:MAG: 2-C-methyl-D-erythritol 4-phosphate cytidylyltransferase [Alloprevotella sp.]|nr:2-C-methyl-D-erythritol 4-phosphate cytidylyltransferase [Alloprevotella sp.]
MKNIAVILAAGSGKRFGAERPKQFLQLCGKSLLRHSIEAFESAACIHEICIVANPAFLEETKAEVSRGDYHKVHHIVAGGKERSDSSLAAISTYAHEDGEQTNLIFHDAARPLLPTEVISAVCNALQREQAVATALPSSDTIFQAENNYIRAIPPRELLRRAQTPQAFRLSLIRQAYQHAQTDTTFQPTDDCGVVLRYQPETPIFLVQGSERSMKLTVPDDLPLLERLAENRQQHNVEKGGSEADALSAYRSRHLRALQLEMLDMLVAVGDILDRAGVRWWMQGGTLLGAMRHGGFIPWDDDMDIDVLADDVPKMVEALRRELPPHLILPDPPSRTPIYKVRNTRTFFVERGDDFAQDYNKGVFIDIFPQTACPAFPRSFTKRVARAYCKADSILTQQHYYSWRSVAELLWFGVKRTALSLLWHTAALFFEKKTYLAQPLRCNGWGLMHRRDKIFPLKRIPFEDRTFPAPADADYYLTEDFGDWHQLPPENQRVSHAVYFNLNLQS